MYSAIISGGIDDISTIIFTIGVCLSLTIIVSISDTFSSAMWKTSPTEFLEMCRLAAIPLRDICAALSSKISLTLIFFAIALASFIRFETFVVPKNILNESGSKVRNGK